MYRPQRPLNYFRDLYLRKHSNVFEELEVSIVDLTVTTAVLLATRSGASKTDIRDRQIHNDTDNSSNTVLLFLFL
jgi:hypothetical protein